MPRPPNPEVRRRLLDAGLNLVHAHGFAASGVKDITDAAGVPKGSFYAYFPSKEAFGAAILEHYWSDIEARLLPILGEDNQARDRLTRDRPGKVEAVATAADENPEPQGVLGSIGRGLARLRETRLDLQTTPLREMRLELQIVFFAIKTPFGEGMTMRIPALMMLRRVGSSDVGQIADLPNQDDN